MDQHTGVGFSGRVALDDLTLGNCFSNLVVGDRSEFFRDHLVPGVSTIENSIFEEASSNSRQSIHSNRSSYLRASLHSPRTPPCRLGGLWLDNLADPFGQLVNARHQLAQLRPVRILEVKAGVAVGEVPLG